MRKIAATMAVFLLVLTSSIPMSTERNNTASYNLMRSEEKLTLSSDERHIDLTWTSRDCPTPTPLEDGSVCEGDHIIISAAIPNITGIPELDIVTTSIRIESGLNFSLTRPLVVPDSDYYAFNGILNVSQFDIVFIENVRSGMYLDLRANFTNNDSDFMAFWADSDPRTWTYMTNVLGIQMVTGLANPETARFLPDREGTLAFLCFSYDLQPGNWTLRAIQPSAEINAESQGNSVTLDTHDIGSNIETSIEVLAYSENGTEFQFTRADVTLTNFFPPEIMSISIEGEDSLKAMTWEVADINELEDHYADVSISGDGGSTFQLLSSYVQGNRFEWNSVSFINRTYIARVRVYDDDPSITGHDQNLRFFPGLTDEIISEPFVAGGIFYSGSPIRMPEIDSPEDVSFYEGFPTHSVGWTPNATGISYYVIRLNDSVYMDGHWEPGNNKIGLPLDALEPGFYRFTISISYVGVSFTEDDTVNVNVLPDPGLMVKHGRQLILLFGLAISMAGVAILLRTEIVVNSQRV